MSGPVENAEALWVTPICRLDGRVVSEGDHDFSERESASSPHDQHGSPQMGVDACLDTLTDPAHPSLMPTREPVRLADCFVDLLTQLATREAQNKAQED